jgi:guanylate kinase
VSKPSQPLTGQSLPLLIVLSGPSGAGKDTVINRMKALAYPLHYIVTVTTRRKRAGEKDGVDYYFVSEARFREMSQQGELLECAQVYGNWYGTPRGPVRLALSQGQDVIIKTDVQGAATIKRLVPQAVFIFLVPPSLKELEKRLRERNTENHFDLELRLRTARAEMEQLPNFDYVVVNQDDGLEQVVSCVISIITAEKCRGKQRRVEV